MVRKLFNKIICALGPLIFLINLSCANVIVTSELELKIKELKAKKENSLQTVNVRLYAIDRDLNKIDLSFFKKHNIQHYLLIYSVAAWVPLNLIDDMIKEAKGVAYIDLPKEAIPLEIISEGRDAIGATPFVLKGVDGKNVKIAVLDTGFKNFDILQNCGELPKNLITKNFVGNYVPTDLDPRSETESHGSGCAEIIHDIAPGAEIHLLKVKTDADIAQACAYCQNNNINIANCSIGFDGECFMDGTSSVSMYIDSYTVNQNILFVVAAGNGAQRSWFGKYNDSPSNPGYMRFANGTDFLDIKISTNTDTSINLIWNDFYNRTTQYSLELCENDGTPISSARSVVGAPPKVSIENSRGHSLYKLKIKKDLDPNHERELKIYISKDQTNGNIFTNPVDVNPESSIISPADAKEALTVGAVNVHQYTSSCNIEDYSARGPRRNSLSLSSSIKPDLVAPSGVKTISYENTGFYGTSASTPHVSAVAALLLNLDPTLSTNTSNGVFKKRILENVQALGAIDNTYGYGKLMLDNKTIPFNNIGNFVCYPNPVSLKDKGYIKITNFPFHTSLIDIIVYTVTGEFVKSFTAEDLITDISINKRMIKWDLKNQSGDLVVPGIYFVSIKTVVGKNQVKKIAVSR